MDDPWDSTLGAIEAIFYTSPLSQDIEGLGVPPPGAQKITKIFFQNLDFSGQNSLTVGLNITLMSNLRVLNASVHYLHKK